MLMDTMPLITRVFCCCSLNGEFGTPLLIDYNDNNKILIDVMAN